MVSCFIAGEGGFRYSGKGTNEHIKPAARKLGLDWVNWQVLRRSYATWVVEAGADSKAVQGHAAFAHLHHQDEYRKAMLATTHPFREDQSDNTSLAIAER